MDRAEAFRLVDDARTELSAIRSSEQNAALQLRETVRRAYQEAEVSQADLARYLNMHRNTIATWCA